MPRDCVSVYRMLPQGLAASFALVWAEPCLRG